MKTMLFDEHYNICPFKEEYDSEKSKIIECPGCGAQTHTVCKCGVTIDWVAEGDAVHADDCTSIEQFSIMLTREELEIIRTMLASDSCPAALWSKLNRKKFE